MKVHELSACPSCGGTDWSPVMLDGSGGHHELRRCSACQLTYADSYADWDEIYTEGYLTEEARFGIDASGAVMQEWLDFCGQKRMRWLERHLGGKGSFLDVGCGTGEVLRNAARRGWEAVGVEPVAESAETARAQGLTVHATTLEQSGLEERSFDVVGAYHVLEHMPEGTEFLRTISRWARPGGHVVIEVPNFRSIHRRNEGSGWPHLRPLEHVAHYSPATLRDTLERAGLEPVRVGTMGFQWPQNRLDHTLSGLGMLRWLGPLSKLTRTRTSAEGKPGAYPLPPLRVALRGVEAVYDLARVGQVVVGLAKVRG